MQTITAIAKPSKVSPTLLELFYGLSSIKTENVVYVQKDLHYSLRANEWIATSLLDIFQPYKMAQREVFMNSSKRYPEEFKIEAVKQVTDRGHSVAEVAGRLGETAHSLYAWIKKFGPDSVEHQAKAGEQAERESY